MKFGFAEIHFREKMIHFSDLYSIVQTLSGCFQPIKWQISVVISLSRVLLHLLLEIKRLLLAHLMVVTSFRLFLLVQFHILLS